MERVLTFLRWSEENGRWIVLQLSLFFVNVWQIGGALCTNYASVIVFRFLGGLSSAGGSVTLGIVADMFEPNDQQFAVAYIVLSSVAGSVVGPVAGGFLETYLGWRWVFWIMLILGGVVQLLHFFAVPETRSSILLNREAAKRRKENLGNFVGPEEHYKGGLTMHKIFSIWWRPFRMLIAEPIVLFLSLLSGFSDALIFSFLDSYGLIFAQWQFNKIALGLSFIPLLLAYVVGYLSFLPIFKRQRRTLESRGHLEPEARLWWLLYMAPLLPIGLWGFAWTSLGPPIPWIVPLIFSILIGMANFSIYMATIDYMVAAYGPYSSSATGGNGFARDFLAGIAAMYTPPLYKKMPGKHGYQYASTILALLATLVIAPVYWFYLDGPNIRARSKFAEAVGREIAARHDANREANDSFPVVSVVKGDS
jgi:MFS family permease